MQDQWLATLNPQQLAAVLHTEGPAMVLAGAGSGKTRVLTTRVAQLITQHQVTPEGILLVTFTNKAAGEMNQRVEELTGHRLPLSGTFHSICAKILRRHGHFIGLAPGFTIYDSDDQLAVIKQLYKDNHYSVKDVNPKSAKAAISTAKNEMISPEQYEQFASGHFQTFVARLYGQYDARLRKFEAVDFDDLLLLTVKLLHQNKATLGLYQDLLQHVLIDEYQDTNKVQYELTKLLSRPQNNLFVVGDFAQSIYAWRGADYRNMLHLKQDFSDLVEYKLEQNYRSTQSILDAATGIISHTQEHPVLSLWTDKKQRTKIEVLEGQTDQDEANLILHIIQQQLGTYSYNDIAILYRTNAQSRAFEEASLKMGVPYRLVGGFKFYERKEIKDLLAFLRVLVNPEDEVSKQRALKVGKRRYAAFEQLINYRVTSIDKSVKNNESESAEVPSLELPHSPQQLLEKIIDLTQFRDLFEPEDPEDVSRLENIQELLNVAGHFDDVTVFLENIALVQDTYLSDVVIEDQTPAITLMSLHSAKGLEFPVVFLVGLEEGLLPHSRSLLDKRQLEEERRLCYVGVTRAMEKLYLSYARKRWNYGGSSYSVVSRFLHDIPAEIITTRTPLHLPPSPSNGSNNRDRAHQYWQATVKKNRQTSATKPERRVVVDDDALEAVLSGEIDFDRFLE